MTTFLILSYRNKMYRTKEDDFFEPVLLLFLHSNVFEVEVILRLKGQCHEIFCLWFFHESVFPLAPEYCIRTVSNFFENSRRYSQLNPILNTWFRDSCFTCDGSPTIQVFPLIFFT